MPIPSKLQPWFEARQHFRLSHTQIQMAREPGSNPRKFGSLATGQQELWKRPLGEFIAHCYSRRFGRTAPEHVQSLEEVVKRVEVRRRAEGKKSEQSGSTDRAST
ncbi:hypothetical protein P3T40_009044 [Paraburkholderia sp. EB58]|jgi:hypothetical protein